MPFLYAKDTLYKTTCYLEGTAQILAFDTFRNLMKTKYDQDMLPVLDPKLQLLTSDLGIFSFKHHSTNPEKF